MTDLTLRQEPQRSPEATPWDTPRRIESQGRRMTIAT